MPPPIATAAAPAAPAPIALPVAAVAPAAEPSPAASAEPFVNPALVAQLARRGSAAVAAARAQASQPSPCGADPHTDNGATRSQGHFRSANPLSAQRSGAPPGKARRGNQALAAAIALSESK